MRLGLPARLAVLVATTLAVMSFTHPLWNFGVLCVVLGLCLGILGHTTAVALGLAVGSALRASMSDPLPSL